MDNNFLKSTLLGKYLTRNLEQPEEVQTEEDEGYDFPETPLDKAHKYLELHKASEAGSDFFWGKIDQETKDWIDQITTEGERQEESIF